MRPCAVEALLRWHHPQLGLLGPDQFLSLAEALGPAAALGGWVFHAACRPAAASGVVSEGIESAQQHTLLHTLGCDCGQGYWYLPPSTETQLQAWLAQFSGKPAPEGGNGPAPSA